MIPWHWMNIYNEQLMRLTLKQTTDYQAIAQMDSVLFSDDHPVESWNSHIWWIGYVAGKPVCYCSIKDEGSGIAYLSRSGVIPSYRGNGFQKRMIRKREDWCKTNNIVSVISDTAYWNSTSINSLIRCGYRVYTPVIPWSNETQLYWIKRIGNI
jgi:GNAT superfamily N-acetyltransferase